MEELYKIFTNYVSLCLLYTVSPPRCSSTLRFLFDYVNYYGVPS
jgi:hypothetical protein